MDISSDIKIKEEKNIKDDNEDVQQFDFDVKIKVESDLDIDEFWCIPNDFISQNADEGCGHTIAYNDLIQYSEEECPFCERIYFNNYSLMKHNLTHLQVELNRLLTYQCNICNAYYTSQDKLGKHIKNEHGERIITMKETIDTDTNSDTNDVPITKSLHQCYICGKIFSYKTWHSHMKEVHGEKVITCSICKWKFKCQRYLRRHMLYKHQGVKPSWRFHRVTTNIEMACDKCPSTFKNRSSLTCHIRNCHSDTLYQCPKCDSKLKSKPYLQTHMKRVHYDDGKTYKCFCGKKFKSPRYLKVHYKNSGHKEI